MSNLKKAKAEANEQWTGWRRFIARNPLTGTWITLVIGLAIGFVAGAIIL